VEAFRPTSSAPLLNIPELGIGDQPARLFARESRLPEILLKSSARSAKTLAVSFIAMAFLYA